MLQRVSVYWFLCVFVMIFAACGDTGILREWRRTSALPAVRTGAPQAKIALGDNFGCGLFDNTGTAAHCWGVGTAGQLGGGFYSNSTRPQPITGVIGAGTVSAISAGGENVCAAYSNKSLWCWGAGNAGILGDGTLRNRAEPRQVSTLNGSDERVLAVSVGSAHACALTDDGVWCWGYSGNGQIGIGHTDTPRGVPETLRPTLVTNHPSTAPPTGIAAGGFHSCAVYADGSVACWGYGGYGQLGNSCTYGTSTAALQCSVDQTQPAAVPLFSASRNTGGLPGVRAESVRAGINHTCVVTADHHLYCFGRNDSGQLGIGTRIHQSVPQHVGSLRGIVGAVALGDAHTCALTTAGRVWCFGDNRYGQLGNNSTRDSSVPVRVDFGNFTPHPRLVGISAGKYGNCAWDNTGKWWCWGDNTTGRLGVGESGGSSAIVTTPQQGGGGGGGEQ